MSYTPINPDVFTAAYAGCVSAFEGGFQLSTNSNPTIYTGASKIAGAFAQAFDAEWDDAVAVNSLELGMIRGLCLEAMTTRVPLSILSPEASSLNPGMWRPYCAALIAMIEEGGTYFAAQGIPIPPVYPPLPPGTGETVVAVPFGFATPSPLVLGAISAGQIMNRASLQIQTPFNGVFPALSFGTTSNPVQYLDCSGIASPGFSVSYQNDELSVSPLADILLLTLTLSGATQGAGVLLYKLL